MVNQVNTCEEVTELQGKQNVRGIGLLPTPAILCFREQNQHWITNESKACNLVSWVFLLGHCLAKLLLCAWRVNEPLPCSRTCKQPSCMEHGIISAADDNATALQAKKKSIQEAAPNHQLTQGLWKTSVWVKCKCTCRRQGESKAEQGLLQSPVTVSTSGSSEIWICCPVMVPPPLCNLLPKGTVIFFYCLELQPGNYLQEIFILLNVNL